MYQQIPILGFTNILVNNRAEEEVYVSLILTRAKAQQIITLQRILLQLYSKACVGKFLNHVTKTTGQGGWQRGLEPSFYDHPS